MNEILFLFHIFLVVGFVLIALRFGKSALIATAAIQGILANLFVMKQMKLFGFSVTCSDVFAVGSILSLNLLQEFFGKGSAKEAVKISFTSLIFFALASQIHLLYSPADSDGTQGAFLTIFSSSLRVVFASLLTFFFVQQLNVRFFSLLRGKLSVRLGLSLMGSQLLDTIVFSFLGLYGLVEAIFDVILVSFLIKCLIVALSAPFTVFSKRFVRHDPV